MKRTRLTRPLAVFLMLVMAAGVLAACGGQDEEPESRKKGLADEIVGTWTNEPVDGDYEGVQVKFRFGGEFELTVTYAGQTNSVGGEYEVGKDKTLTLYRTTDDPYGDVDKMEFEYSKEHAGREGYWYYDGTTLYLEGAELHRK